MSNLILIRNKVYLIIFLLIKKFERILFAIFDGCRSYSLIVSLLFKQGITPKTLVSLSLAFLLVCIQVLWKDGAQTVQ